MAEGDIHITIKTPQRQPVLHAVTLFALMGRGIRSEPYLTRSLLGWKMRPVVERRPGGFYQDAICQGILSDGLSQLDSS